MSYNMWDANADGKTIDDLAIDLQKALLAHRRFMDDYDHDELGSLPMFTDTERVIVRVIEELRERVAGAALRIDAEAERAWWVGK